MSSSQHPELPRTSRSPIAPPVLASYVLAAFGLWLMLYTGLVASLFSGLLVYALVHMLSPVLGRRINDLRARSIAVALLGALIVLLLSLGIWGAISFLHSEAGNMENLFQRLADILEQSRGQLPDWLLDFLPDSAEALRAMATEWLRANAATAQHFGQTAGRTLVHILIGMVIGMMCALYDAVPTPNHRPLAAALHARVVALHDAFRRIVFAQVRIAGINAALTAIYLMLLLPLFGIHLPLHKTLVAVTFLAGLLPVVGNLISNTVIVIVALSHSLGVALASLLYLIVIHKLEYFLNAKIIGLHINARAWELLTAMLVMEALFGLTGVVAAPVFYAYLKKELSDLDLV